MGVSPYKENIPPLFVQQHSDMINDFFGNKMLFLDKTNVSFLHKRSHKSHFRTGVAIMRQTISPV